MVVVDMTGTHRKCTLLITLPHEKRLHHLQQIYLFYRTQHIFLLLDYNIAFYLYILPSQNEGDLMRSCLS